jgi:hypothetical protein
LAMNDVRRDESPAATVFAMGPPAKPDYDSET